MWKRRASSRNGGRWFPLMNTENLKRHLTGRVEPRSGLYLADGYDIVHSYTDGLELKKKKNASVES